MLANQGLVGTTGDRNIRTSNQCEQPTGILYALFDVDHSIDDSNRSNIYVGTLQQIEKSHIVIKR
jgi:hypothetical protein